MEISTKEALSPLHLREIGWQGNGPDGGEISLLGQVDNDDIWTSQK